MKKKKKNKELSLSEIIENEIKYNSLRQGFSKNLINFCKSLKYKKTSQHIDLSSIPFVTIDGDDSKDFDDAVWSENKNKKSKVMVAIADVSFYVKHNDPIDLEAKKRGNSFYFIDRVIPMLPEELSNDLCSLIPKKIRKSVVVEINLNNGKLENFKIHRALIKSVARLTYKQAEEIFLSKDSNKKIFPLIQNLFETYKILNENSKKRQKIFFDPDEFFISPNKNQNIFLEKKKKLQSYKLIEEFMVLTNTIVGNFLKKNNISSIFRNHHKPKKEKIEELKAVISNHNINFSGKFNSQKDFNEILDVIKKKNLSFLNDFLLKSQSRAFYSTENEGHFGLSLNNYVHFTSPIRRYSDLIVHRDLIDFYFFQKKKSKSDSCDHLNFQEKKADLIDRFIFDRATCMYLKKFKNYQFRGFIDSVENFGIFIKAIDFPFSGLARFRSDRLFSNLSKVNNDSFKTGQLVTFKIKKINTQSGKILIDKVKKV